ncbi:MAG: pre-peptidase C-terminal domain-containing protein [Lentisphaeraceae bacterium]|nr:pre-peptidase C-terminal domain-containing protein [Lentisphaeraceae bacterium]
MKTLITILGLLFFTGQALATPSLKFVIPAGGQRGQEVEVTFTGGNLQEIQDVVFYEKGLELVKIIKKEGNKLKVLVRIKPDCKLGPHLVRLFGKDQFSNARFFSVGQFPEKNEKENNGDRETAEEVTKNITVNGVLQREDIDYFKIKLKKDEVLNLEVEAQRLGHGFSDPHISLFNEEGFLVKDVDDSVMLKQDPILTFKATKEGTYFIAVRSSDYQGHGNSRYRLHIGDYPRPYAIYPAGGQPGSEQEVSIILDNGETIKQKIKFPSEGDIFEFYPQVNGIFTPSFIPLQISSLKPYLEKQPNNEKKEITESPNLPLVFDGIIEKAEDVDWFSFTAKKGTDISVIVDARSLRSPLDSLLEVYNEKGKLIKRQDDSPGPDATINFKADKDGPFYIRILDHLKNGGPDYTYRISVIERPRTISLDLPSQDGRQRAEKDQALTISKGTKRFCLLQVKRDRVSGKDDIKFENLPPGVTAKVVKYKPNSGNIPVIFEAKADVKEQFFFASPKISVESGQKGGFSQRIPINYSGGGNGGTYIMPRLDHLTLGVADKTPFKLRLEKNSLPLPRYGYHDIVIHVDRDKGYEGDIDIRLKYRQDGLSGIDRIVLKKDQNKVTYRINAAGNAPEGEWPVVFTAYSGFKGRTYEVCEEYSLNVIPHFLNAKLSMQSFRQGDNGKLEISLEQLNAFEGKATAKLMGLTNGLTAKELTIDKNSKSLSFDLTVGDKTRKGTHKNLFVSFDIPFNGKTLPQNLYTGGEIRIDPPLQNKPKVAKKTDAKKPARKLTRLEELRLQKQQRSAKK